MKRYITNFACALLCLVMVVGVCATRAAALEVSATSAIVVDAASGRVLWSHNANERRYIASITKMMTALVVMESGHSLDEIVHIRPEDTGAEGSSMYLRAGEDLHLETLMYGLLLASGNDSAVALANYCYGSVDAFVAEMNRKAAQLGMTNSHFVNPNGLTEEGHMSTAADMAKLAIVCMQDETIAKMVGTRTISIEGRTFTNHNKMLWRYEGCNGMKTGYTEKSGRTLITCAQRDGRLLVAVTLNAPDDWNDHTKMLDYGFSVYDDTCLSEAGTVCAKTPISGSLLSFVNIEERDTLHYPLKAGEEVRKEVSLIPVTQAPVFRGQTAGTVSYYLNDKIIGVCPLVYGSSVQKDAMESHKLLDRIHSIFEF